MVALGGFDAGWNPGGSRIGEKSSLISDDSAGPGASTFFLKLRFWFLIFEFVELEHFTKLLLTN